MFNVKKRAPVAVLMVAGAGLLCTATAASAHTATAKVDCATAAIAYTSFAPNANGRTNAVKYRTSVDGTFTADRAYTLADDGGRSGKVSMASAPADGKQHTVAVYTAWGSAGRTTTVDNHSGGSMTTPLVSRTFTCAAPTPPPAPEAPTPTEPSSTGPVPAPAAPAPPAIAAPVRNAVPAKCVSTPDRGFRVRAGQVSTIRVRARTNAGERARVTVTAPGVRKVKRTDADGRVSFRVKPTRAGSLRVTSDSCFGADRTKVLKRKQTTSKVEPRFAG